MNGKKIIDIDLDRWSEPGKTPDGTKNKCRAALKDFPARATSAFRTTGPTSGTET